MRLLKNKRTVTGMAEYIEKEALINSFRSCGASKDLIDSIVYRINLQEAADVAPVRHGQWKCNKPCPVCGEDRFKGLDADIWADWEPPYCPNCGAKMDEEVSE